MSRSLTYGVNASTVETSNGIVNSARYMERPSTVSFSKVKIQTLEEFRDIVRDGVEGRMWRSNLRSSPERNQIIDQVYAAYKQWFNKDGSIKFEAVQDRDYAVILDLKEKASRLARLADIVQHGALLISEDEFSKFNLHWANTPQLRFQSEKEKEDFYTSVYSLLWEQKYLNSYRHIWRDEKFRERGEWYQIISYGDQDIDAAIDYALSYLGTPYRLGGISRDGIDCSGLVSVYLAQLAARKGLKYSGRVTTSMLVDFARTGTGYGLEKHLAAVHDGSLKRGDIIVWNDSNGIGHTGIFVGKQADGRSLVLDASSHRSEGQVAIRGLTRSDLLPSQRAAFLSERRLATGSFYVLRPRSNQFNFEAANKYGIQKLAGKKVNPEIVSLVGEIASKHGLNEKLLLALVISESGGNPYAVSRKGAMGLTQLMPGTARALGVSNPFDPKENLDGGARYLKTMIQRFGSIELALAAYNAGPGAVIRYGGIPPYRETQRYVRAVLNRTAALMAS